jgi:hypothetical protein
VTTLDELLKGKPLSDFAPDDLSRKAHWRWDRDQLHEAFLLFEAASRRAVELGDGRALESTRNRAAITRYRSGADLEDGLRRLEEVLRFYESRPEHTGDSHFCEWAATELVLHAHREDPSAFGPRYRELRDRCRAVGLGAFPSIHPQQEELARAALDAGDLEALSELADAIERRWKVSRKLQKEIRAWRAASEAAGGVGTSTP